eukprot:scaffold108707_cov18-Tisochrysis_lutea.AAC.3
MWETHYLIQTTFPSKGTLMWLALYASMLLLHLRVAMLVEVCSYLTLILLAAALGTSACIKYTVDMPPNPHGIRECWASLCACFNTTLRRAAYHVSFELPLYKTLPSTQPALWIGSKHCHVP